MTTACRVRFDDGLALAAIATTESAFAAPHEPASELSKQLACRDNGMVNYSSRLLPALWRRMIANGGPQW